MLNQFTHVRLDNMHSTVSSKSMQLELCCFVRKGAEWAVVIRLHIVHINAWEFIAADRPLWHRSIYQATAKYETEKAKGDVSTYSRLPSI